MNALLSAFRRLNRGDVELEGLLPDAEVESACESASYQDRSRLYTPALTIRAFIAQVLSPDRSCREAVAGVAGHRAATGKPACSADTGGYCKARSRISKEVNRTI